MSTSNQLPPNQAATGGTFQPQPVTVGGTLTANPLPNEPFFPIRRDQFLTFCEGDMSGAKSMRDICIGTFLAGAVGVAGILLTIDWDVAVKQGRHPLMVTLILSTLTFSSLVVGLIEHRGMKRTSTKSSYSRLIQAIAEYFGIPVP